MDLWPLGQGQWDLNSSKIFSRWTYGTNLKILRDFLLQLLQLQDFWKTWPLTVEATKIETCLRFLSDASVVWISKFQGALLSSYQCRATWQGDSLAEGKVILSFTKLRADLRSYVIAKQTCSCTNEQHVLQPFGLFSKLIHITFSHSHIRKLWVQLKATMRQMTFTFSLLWTTQ